ncbi:MAG TPA: hypothetical protein VF533_00820 [Solirubrobacteraceae bacterium]|jgi:flagellar biosynthesis GTPase FlhF
MIDTLMEPEVKIFRGRSLEEVLPQIRAELGPDAIVLRRREGLTGGIGGFFQRPYVEVEASGPDGGATLRAAADAALEARNDRATAEGMASPAIQLLLDQASPFADQLQAAQHADRTAADRAADILGSTARTDPGLYGPQPNVTPPAEAAPPAAEAEPFISPPSMPAVEPAVEPRPAEEPREVEAREAEETPAEDEPPAPDPLAAPFESTTPDAFEVPAEPPVLPTTTEVLAPRPAAAVAAERRLVLAGLDSALAADVVGEALTHGLPFSNPRSLKKLVRASLARRIPVLHGRGPRARALAFVGAGGAGKTTAAGHLAAAYAEAGTLPVLAIALRAADNGAALRTRLNPADVAVHAAADGAEARRIAELARGAMVIVDTPAISLRDAAGIAALAADLEALDLDEIHLALPATLSAAAAAELARALEGVGLTHVALTRTDETEHPGAPIGFCITSGGPISYLCGRDAVEPADPVTLAQRLLP